MRELQTSVISDSPGCPAGVACVPRIACFDEAAAEDNVRAGSTGGKAVDDGSSSSSALFAVDVEAEGFQRPPSDGPRQRCVEDWGEGARVDPFVSDRQVSEGDHDLRPGGDDNVKDSLREPHHVLIVCLAGTDVDQAVSWEDWASQATGRGRRYWDRRGLDDPAVASWHWVEGAGGGVVGADQNSAERWQADGRGSVCGEGLRPSQRIADHTSISVRVKRIRSCRPGHAAPPSSRCSAIAATARESGVVSVSGTCRASAMRRSSV